MPDPLTLVVVTYTYPSYMYVTGVNVYIRPPATVSSIWKTWEREELQRDAEGILWLGHLSLTWIEFCPSMPHTIVECNLAL